VPGGSLVANTYSEDEKQQRVDWCNSAIEEIQQEVIKLRDDFLRSHSGYNNPMEKHRNLQEYKQEANIKVLALTDRIQQILDKDPDGQFIVPCFEIEQKLDKFKVQLGLDIDSASQTTPISPHGLSNKSIQD